MNLDKSLQELYNFFIEGFKSGDLTYDDMRQKIKEDFEMGEINSRIHRNIMLNVLKKATVNHYSKQFRVMTEKETVEFLNEYYDISSN